EPQRSRQPHERGGPLRSLASSPRLRHVLRVRRRRDRPVLSRALPQQRPGASAEEAGGGLSAHARSRGRLHRLDASTEDAGARPLFVHFAPGAVHGPHQPPLDWRGRNAGRFDLGWDRYREETLERQIELGVVPRGTKLTARPEGIPAWDGLSVDEQRLYARQM